MIFAKRNFNETNEVRDNDTGSKAERAMPKETTCGKPLDERRIPSRDFGFEGANIKFRR